MTEPDEEKIDQAVLGLLFLTSFREGRDLGHRAWKGHDWGAMERLFEKGLIFNPVGKAKSVEFTEEGHEEAAKAFQELFSKEQG